MDKDSKSHHDYENNNDVSIPSTVESSKFDSLLRCIDPVVSQILDSSLSEKKETSPEDAVELLSSKDILTFHLTGLVADELRRRKVGNKVTFVTNRNINFTNVCIKQCGFCAFSRDFREEEGYFLPVEEVVRRAKEARSLGATEVCVQAGLPPRMEGDTYEKICKAIKETVPDIHIHGFSPEEVLYGSECAGVSIREFLKRLKDAGVGSIPGTSAEILDQALRDKISPGRISVKDWINIIKTAHKIGLPSTSTVMYGHMETSHHIAKHMQLLREIQKETRGFTEFVPLSFIHDEAPMYKFKLHDGIRKGATGNEVLLIHAVARIMLNNYVENIQTSWVKEGISFSQLLLSWGANDVGGTLINESISTAAGAAHGQLFRPREIKKMISQVGKIPVQRSTLYKPLRIYGNYQHPGSNNGEYEKEPLDQVTDATSRFGSYHELIKLKKYRYSRPT